jgi:hypothetical protein
MVLNKMHYKTWVVTWLVHTVLNKIHYRKWVVTWPVHTVLNKIHYRKWVVLVHVVHKKMICHLLYIRELGTIVKTVEKKKSQIVENCPSQGEKKEFKKKKEIRFT